MARRVHELAKEWGVETRDLIARLDRIGIRGRRSQSSLSEEEVERATTALGLGERPNVAIGQERVITDTTGQRVVERRVGTKVIRRRASAPTAPPAEAELGEAFPAVAAPEGLETFAMPEGFAELTEPQPIPTLSDLTETVFPEPVPIETEPEPAAADVEERVPEPEPATAEAREPAPAPEPVRAKAPPVSVPTPSAEVKPRKEEPRPLGPRVLGRIDLKKAEAERAAALERSAAQEQRARRAAAGAPVETAEAAPVEAARTAPGKRKKRKVIQKPEFAEAGDREFRHGGRLPRKKRAAPGKEQRKTEITTPRASKRVVRISEVVSVGDLARAMGVKAAEVVKKLMESGVMATINQVLDAETATLIASEFGYNVENVSFDLESAIQVGHEPAGEESLQLRPPVITIMGHVDHGKTSLLDAIRETNVTSEEAGGITQHIGAYSVQVNSKHVTFLDTPGHEAFTAMRARGSKVTDVVVLVVAADDGVMPQTVEAINHARAANVPIVVAVNKIDKPEANIDRIKQNLTEHGLVPEDWGGDTICVPVSAKTKNGLPQLLEMLLLQSEVLELKANPDKPARGVIIEAKLDRGRGPVATVLVQEGTLKVGDPFICGANYGRVRAMIDDKGHKVTAGGPSTPVEILGMGAVPEAGSAFVVVADEATARQVADHRREKQREASLVKTAKVSLDDLYRQIQAGDTKELRVVIKADVQGSVEALSDALTRLSTDEVRLNVLHASVGGITESDVMLASASNAVVIGFNVRPETKANDAAEREGVDVRLYTVIYDALNEIRDAMEGLLEPTLREKVVGRAEVRQVFSIPGGGNVAGCIVADGSIRRNAAARLVRDHVVVHQGKVASLRRFKEDAREVQSGYECGIGLEGFNDLKTGDVIEVYEMEQVARRLTPATGRGAAVERAF